jgi:hypothetical protein
MKTDKVLNVTIVVKSTGEIIVKNQLYAVEYPTDKISRMYDAVVKALTSKLNDDFKKRD